MKAFRYLICLAAAVGISGTALAGTFTFVTPSGATDAAGDPVNAEAIFTTSAGMLSITLQNLLVNQKDVGQNISDLFFTFNNVTAGGSLSSSSGLERTVHPDGTFTDGSMVSTGWAFSVTGGVFHLNGLAGAADVPAHTTLGGPDGSNLYSNSNASINGEVGHPKHPNPHNPFLVGDVTFTLAIAGINSDTTINGVIFSFGTAPGDNVPSRVPDSGTTAMLLGGALTCLGVVRRYVKH